MWGIQLNTVMFELCDGIKDTTIETVRADLAAELRYSVLNVLLQGAIYVL